MISQDVFNGFKEEVFKEMYYLHNLQIQEMRDLMENIEFVKNQNKEIPLKVEDRKISPQAELFPTNTNTPPQVNKVALVTKFISEWESPRRCIRVDENKSNRSSFLLPTTNRFEGLQIYDCNPDEYEIEWPSASQPSHNTTIQCENSRPDSSDFNSSRFNQVSNNSSPVSSSKSYPVLTNSRRPSTVTSNFPENDDPSRYRKRKPAPAEPKNITMVVDSMVKFRVRDFNQDMRDYGIHGVKCMIHKFPAATAEQIEEYTPGNVRRNKADGLLIHSGTNSLGVKDRFGNLVWTDEDIIAQIVGTAFRARKDGVRKIFISSLIERRGRFFNEKISNINSILYQICHQNDFIFINNCNLNSSHLQDGLHLTDEGLSILNENFLQALY